MKDLPLGTRHPFSLHCTGRKGEVAELVTSWKGKREKAAQAGSAVEGVSMF